MKGRGFGDGLFRLDWGMPRGRVSQCDKMVRALFFRAHKACRRGSESQLLLDFSPLFPFLISSAIFHLAMC